MKTKKLLLALLALAMLFTAACGKEDDPEASTGGDGGGTASGTEEEVAELPEYEVKAQPDLTGTPKELADAGKVKVGVKADQPNLGFKDPTTNEFQGFDIEIAKMIAADLGIAADAIEFVEVPSKNRETALQNGEVDYIVGTYTINDERKKVVSFVGPYYVAGQDLLVMADDEEITGPDTLEGKKVCSATGSTPGKRIQEEYTEAELVEFDVYSKCVDALLNGQVDAVTTDDAILKGYAAQYPDELKVVGETFSEEPYGVGIPLNDTDLQTFIAGALERHQENGDYEKAYNATLGVSGSPMPDIPALES
jgi:glutamate transport system substrate-binding protein